MNYTYFQRKEVQSVKGSFYKSADVSRLNGLIFAMREGVSSYTQSSLNSKGLLTTFLKNKLDKIHIYFLINLKLLIKPHKTIIM